MTGPGRMYARIPGCVAWPGIGFHSRGQTGCVSNGRIIHPEIITRKLVDGALISADLIHQDLKAAIPELVDFLRIETFGNGSEVGHIRCRTSHLRDSHADT